MGIRYTKAERTAYIDAFKSSGLTQTDFCKRQNISFKAFNNWLRLHKKSILPTTSNVKYSAPSQPNFIPVQLAACAVSDDDGSLQTSTIPDVNFSSIIPVKIDGFCVDVPIELLAPKNVTAVKMLLNILHQMHRKQAV
ncbi:MAG: hypothetical protein COY58_09095 [Gammaproteobacteria bacterium CG_4_10_14_0_8_um_filter_38_16]|nr:MAG: hypothetical protein COY58_09095 [Gammaproteobacteria bacterium CG_4_10_14_0_8_um_filter_38_16]